MDLFMMKFDNKVPFCSRCKMESSVEILVIGLMVSFVLEIEDIRQHFEKRLRLIGSDQDVLLCVFSLLTSSLRGVNHSSFCVLVK